MTERALLDQQARGFFDDLWHQGDHWELESSAFEQQRYARLLALLPRPHYPRVLELGCGAGTFTRFAVVQFNGAVLRQRERLA